MVFQYPRLSIHMRLRTTPPLPGRRARRHVGEKQSANLDGQAQASQRQIHELPGLGPQRAHADIDRAATGQENRRQQRRLILQVGKPGRGQIFAGAAEVLGGLLLLFRR